MPAETNITPETPAAAPQIENGDKIFHVEGWGEVGFANLYAFVPFPGFKHPAHLDINEHTEGRCQNPTSDKKPERITRIK